MPSCEHKWVFQGVVYGHSNYSIPGSGAYARLYSDRYFCEKCLEPRDANEREFGNSYQKALPGTLPK